jgi:apolipoprotein N-acyltransferase
LIVWPEASTPWAVRGQANMKTFVESLARRANAPLLLGSIAIENGDKPDEKLFNAAFVVTPAGGVQDDYYAKRQLVAFGEFVPLRPILGWLSKVVPVGDEDFSPGKDSSPLLIPLGGKPEIIGPLICYEDVYPELARRSTLAGAVVLVVITNNGWFGEGGAAYQHAAHSVLRAVENRRPLLRCGNGGWSGWIDEYGAIRATLTDEHGSIYFRGTKTIEVKRDSRWIDHTSFYTEYGDWFVFLSIVLALLGAAVLKYAPPVPVETNAG